MPKKTSKKSVRRAATKAASNGAPAKKAAKKAQAASKTKAARRPARKAAARKSRRVQPIPDTYGPVTPQLVVSPCAEALEFYERALGAKVMGKMAGPDGLVVHAEMNVGGSVIMLADELNMPGMAVRKSPKNAGAITGGVMLYVKDVDAAFERAVAAGAKPSSPPQDMFWGDRFGQVEDPYGHVWAMATHLRDVSPEEMEAAMASMANMGGSNAAEASAEA
jgi:PhnB protein